MRDKTTIQSARDHLDAIMRDRAFLADQIKQSQETIATSQELIRRLDEVLAKYGVKP